MEMWAVWCVNEDIIEMTGHAPLSEYQNHPGFMMLIASLIVSVVYV